MGAWERHIRGLGLRMGWFGLLQIEMSKKDYLDTFFA